MQFSPRQLRILEIVKAHQPITSEQIAQHLGLRRATLRPDLSILTMSGRVDARPKVGYFYVQGEGLNASLPELSKKTIGEVMSIPVILDAKCSVHDAIIKMFLEDVGSIFITEEGYLCGVVSRKDLLKSAVGGDTERIPVSLAMTRTPNVVCAFAEESVLQGAARMIRHEFDSLPVVEKSSDSRCKVIGRFSKTTVTRLFVELIQE